MRCAMARLLVVANAVAVMARVPGNFAVLALAGGAGFAVATRRYARIRKQARE